VTGEEPVPAASATSVDGEVSVTLLQLAATMDWQRNLEVVTRLARAGSSTGLPRLMVAPEAVMCDFGPPSFDLSTVAQPLDGPFVDGLSALARTTGACLVAGMLEAPEVDEAPPGRVFNTVVVLAPDGGLVTSYRKVHLYDAFGYCESDRIAAGSDASLTFGYGGLRFGLMTCYDLRFAEQATGLAESGAQVLLVPAAWLAGPHKADHWRTLIHARAIETTCYVAAAGQGGTSYVGGSTVIDPMGIDLAAPLGGADGTVSAVVSAARVAETRKLNPTLANRSHQPSLGLI
jgi:deaminated glutathione amidase